MSVQAISWALGVENLPSSAKFVLVCLANYADGECICFPGQKKLANDTGLTDRTVRSALKSLEEKGFIERRYRHRQDGTRTSDEYKLLTDDNRKPFPVENDDNRKSTTRQPETISGQYKPNGLSEPSEEPSDARERAKPSDFDRWYLQYPHKIGKLAAQKSWAKVCKQNVPLRSLLDGLTNYKQHKPPDCPWCNPATWLNQGRWEDTFEGKADEKPKRSREELLAIMRG